ARRPHGHAVLGGAPALPSAIVPLPDTVSAPHSAFASSLPSLPCDASTPSTREKLSPTPLAGIVRLPVMDVPRMRLSLPETVTLPAIVTRPPSTPSPNRVTRLPEKSRSP